jgi:hypothetical protein
MSGCESGGCDNWISETIHIAYLQDPCPGTMFTQSTGTQLHNLDLGIGLG